MRSVRKVSDHVLQHENDINLINKSYDLFYKISPLSETPLALDFWRTTPSSLERILQFRKLFFTHPIPIETHVFNLKTNISKKQMLHYQIILKCSTDWTKIFEMIFHLDDKIKHHEPNDNVKNK